jgi:hypothetical protein
MTTLADLLTGSAAVDGRPEPDPNPLTEDDALQEAQLLSVRFGAVTGAAGLLFELRTALQLDEGNTGLLVAHGVRELVWSAPERDGRTAWTVGGSTVVRRPRFELELGLWPSPGAQLRLAAERAAFFIGDVPSLGDAPPDYGEDDEAAIRAALADWDSPFELAGAAFLS